MLRAARCRDEHVKEGKEGEAGGLHEVPARVVNNPSWDHPRDPRYKEDAACISSKEQPRCMSASSRKGINEDGDAWSGPPMPGKASRRSSGSRILANICREGGKSRRQDRVSICAAGHGHKNSWIRGEHVARDWSINRSDERPTRLDRLDESKPARAHILYSYLRPTRVLICIHIADCHANCTHANGERGERAHLIT